MEEKLKEHEEIKTLNSELMKKIEELTKLNNDLTFENNTLNEEVQKLSSDNIKLETTIKNCTEEINSRVAIEEYDELSNKLQKTQKINVMLSDENDDLKEKIESFNLKIKDYTNQNTELQENISTLNECIKFKEAELKEFKELNIKQSLEEKNILENKISILENDLQDALNKKELFKSRNKEINFQLQNFKYKVLDLEKKLMDSQFNLAVEKREKNPLLR